MIKSICTSTHWSMMTSSCGVFSQSLPFYPFRSPYLAPVPSPSPRLLSVRHIMDTIQNQDVLFSVFDTTNPITAFLIRTLGIWRIVCPPVSLPRTYDYCAALTLTWLFLILPEDCLSLEIGSMYARPHQTCGSHVLPTGRMNVLQKQKSISVKSYSEIKCITMFTDESLVVSSRVVREALWDDDRFWWTCFSSSSRPVVSQYLYSYFCDVTPRGLAKILKSLSSPD